MHPSGCISRIQTYWSQNYQFNPYFISQLILNKQIMSKKPTIVTLAAAVLIITGATFSDRVFASSTSAISTKKGEYAKHQNRDNGVGGTVESITNSLIVIKTKDSVTYTIDTTNVKLFKGKDTVINLSDIKVGDKIFAKGTISGNIVIATEIHNGKTASGNGLKKAKKQFQGVIGVVTSINGNSITLTGKDNTVYVVDASDATIKKGSVDATTTITEVKSGDHLFVRGAVTGTSVVATDIMDGKGTGKKVKKDFLKNK